MTAQADCCDYYDVGDGSASSNVNITGYSFSDCEVDDQDGHGYCQSMSFNGSASLGIDYSFVQDGDSGAEWLTLNTDYLTLDVTNGKAYWYPLTVTPQPYDLHYEWWDYQNYATDENNVGIQTSCPNGCNYSSNDAVASGINNAGDGYWDPGVYQTDTVTPDDAAWGPPSESVQWFGFNGDIGNAP